MSGNAKKLYKIQLATDWVARVVMPRIKRDPATGEYRYPDPLPAFARLSRLHQWQKQFRTFPGRFYPMLRVGAEPGRIPEDPDHQDELHWTFLLPFDLEDRAKKGEGLPLSLIRDASFYVSPELASFSLVRDARGRPQQHTAISEFFANCMLTACNIVRDFTTRILLSIDPAPPTSIQLSYFADFAEEADIDGVLEIGEHVYTYEADRHIGWQLFTDAPQFHEARSLSPWYIKN